MFQLEQPLAPNQPTDVDVDIAEPPDLMTFPSLHLLTLMTFQSLPRPAHEDATVVIENKRTQRPDKRVFGDKWVNHTVQLTPRSRVILGHIVHSLSHYNMFLHSWDWDAPFVYAYTSYHSINELYVDPYTDEVKWIHPFTIGAKSTSADTPTLREIQRLTPKEIEDWYETMDVEHDVLLKKGYHDRD